MKQEFIGLIKMKGLSPCIAPGRFYQLKSVRKTPYDLIGLNIGGWVVTDHGFWLVCLEDESGAFIRIPFAPNKAWFDALTSQPPYDAIRDLPQIYVTGIE